MAHWVDKVDGGNNGDGTDRKGRSLSPLFLPRKHLRAHAAEERERTEPRPEDSSGKRHETRKRSKSPD